MYFFSKKKRIENLTFFDLILTRPPSKVISKVKEVSTYISTKVKHNRYLRSSRQLIRWTGLDTLDDPECNLRDHIYYYFVPD